jgi:hypothetical protein
MEDMGLPSGKTKTIAVDLTGKFLGANRELRIVTNLCVYWDEVYAGVETRAPVYTLREVQPQTAELAFHGFSRPLLDPGRLQPESFDYHATPVEAPWSPTPGMYTRYGDVEALLEAADDRMVIMGAGDELRLRYHALPAPARGWKRDYLLYFNGWAKDSDANTAWSQSVEPLPFHKMKQYPYGGDEQYPKTNRQYREQYNTRPMARILP